MSDQFSIEQSGTSRANTPTTWNDSPHNNPPNMNLGNSNQTLNNSHTTQSNYTQNLQPFESPTPSNKKKNPHSLLSQMIASANSLALQQSNQPPINEPKKKKKKKKKQKNPLVQEFLSQQNQPQTQSYNNFNQYTNNQNQFYPQNQMMINNNIQSNQNNMNMNQPMMINNNNMMINNHQPMMNNNMMMSNNMMNNNPQTNQNNMSMNQPMMMVNNMMNNNNMIMNNNPQMNMMNDSAMMNTNMNQMNRNNMMTNIPNQMTFINQNNFKTYSQSLNSLQSDNFKKQETIENPDDDDEETAKPLIEFRQNHIDKYRYTANTPLNPVSPTSPDYSDPNSFDFNSFTKMSQSVSHILQPMQGTSVFDPEKFRKESQSDYNLSRKKQKKKKDKVKNRAKKRIVAVENIECKKCIGKGFYHNSTTIVHNTKPNQPCSKCKQCLICDGKGFVLQKKVTVKSKMNLLNNAKISNEAMNENPLLKLKQKEQLGVPKIKKTKSTPVPYKARNDKNKTIISVQKPDLIVSKSNPVNDHEKEVGKTDEPDADKIYEKFKHLNWYNLKR